MNYVRLNVYKLPYFHPPSPEVEMAGTLFLHSFHMQNTWNCSFVFSFLKKKKNPSIYNQIRFVFTERFLTLSYKSLIYMKYNIKGHLWARCTLHRWRASCKRKKKLVWTQTSTIAWMCTNVWCVTVYHIQFLEPFSLDHNAKCTVALNGFHLECSE